MFEPYNTNRDGLLKDALEASEHPELPTIIAVAKGVKPLTDLWVTWPIYQRLKLFCKKYKLVIDHDNYMGVTPSEEFLQKFEKKRDLGTTKLIGMPYRENTKNSWLKIFIAESQDIIDRGKRVNWYSLVINNDYVTDPPLDNFRFGENLGFPQCCIDFYAFHNMKFGSGGKAGFNTPIEVFKNTRGRFSIYCNNIVMGHWYFLIRHHPCSFNCKNTTKYAKELHKCIKEEDEQYAEKITRHLKYPLLVFGEKNAFAFDGKLHKGKVSYSDVYFLGEGRDKHKAEVFRQGNEVLVTDERISISKDGEFVAGIAKQHEHDGVLMQFE